MAINTDIFGTVELIANLVTILGFIVGVNYVGKIYKIIAKNINVVVDKIDNAYIVSYANNAQIVNVGRSEKSFLDKAYPLKDKFYK